MRDETLSDKLWSGIMIAFAALALILGVIPMYPMYQEEGYVLRSLLNPPQESIMSNICPMVMIVFVYTLVLTVCYYRSQALGTMKAIFVFSVVSLCVSALALLPENVMKPKPFILYIPFWTVMCVISFIRMKKEIKRYDFD